MESIRLATADDLARIAELSGLAVEELKAQRGGELWSRREARRRPVEASLADMALPAGAEVVRTIVLAGALDEVVVGYAIARLEELPDASLLAVIDDIYVEPEARGVGVGEALMERLLEWAADEGCVGLDAIVLPGNRAAKNFFERYGLTARAILVHRPILPPLGKAG